MRKLKINKVVSLTLCFVLAFGITVSAKSVNKTSNVRSYYSDEVDPHPHVASFLK